MCVCVCVCGSTESLVYIYTQAIQSVCIIYCWAWRLFTEVSLSASLLRIQLKHTTQLLNPHMFLKIKLV